MRERRKWKRPELPGGEIDDTVYYRGSDPFVQETHRQAKERLHMARVVGTGSDGKNLAGPGSKLNKGVIGDVPGADWDEAYSKVFESDEVEARPDLEISNERDIANGLVRGDPISHPEERKIALELRDRAFDIAVTDDVNAQQGDATKDLSEEDHDAEHLHKLNRFDPGEDYTLSGVREANVERVSQSREAPAPKQSPAPQQGGEKAAK